MFRKIAFSLLLISSFAAMAVDEENVLSIDTEITPYFHISINGNPLYIGDSKDKENLEKAYGKQFPLNTIFFQIQYKEYSDELGQLPDCVTYDDIKDKKEGDSIKLTVGGKPYTLVCQHKGRKNWYGEMEFQAIVAGQIGRFKERANWLVESTFGDNDGASEKSLADAGVINLNDRWGTSRGHGENCSPHVKQVRTYNFGSELFL